MTSKPVRRPHTATSVSASGSDETSRNRKCGTSVGRDTSHDDSQTRSGSVGRNPTNTSERRRARCASHARPGDGTRRMRASPGPRQRLSGNETRPERCSSGGPDDCACIGSSAGVSTTGGRRPPSAASSACSQRSSNAVVTTARHGKRTHAVIASGTDFPFGYAWASVSSTSWWGTRSRMNAIASVIRPAPVRRATTCRASENTSRPDNVSVSSFQPGAPASSLHPRPATRTTCRSFSRSTSESGISTMRVPRARNTFSYRVLEPVREESTRGPVRRSVGRPARNVQKDEPLWGGHVTRRAG